MSKPQFDKICIAFNLAFGTDPESIKHESTPADILGWDSLGHVRLVAELEKAFNTTFEVDEVMEMEDVAAILKIISFKRL
jgi:acyl carrier protein